MGSPRYTRYLNANPTSGPVGEQAAHRRLPLGRSGPTLKIQISGQTECEDLTSPLIPVLSATEHCEEAGLDRIKIRPVDACDL
jgi:hypothetical protein